MQQETREAFYKIMRPKWPGSSIMSDEVQKEIRHTVYRSRWGWHPVSYEDFQILKALHKRYWETLRQAYVWQRWARKEPQNRVVYRMHRNEAGQIVGREVVCALPEPAIDTVFIDATEKSEFHVSDERGWGFGGRTHHCLFTPRLGSQVESRYRELNLRERSRRPNIVADFKRARTPQEDPEALAPLDMTQYRALWESLTAEAV